jgi:hypothetical protein
MRIQRGVTIRHLGLNRIKYQSKNEVGGDSLLNRYVKFRMMP